MPETKTKKPSIVITPEFRLSFPELFSPRAFRNQEPKYSVAMLFAKDADLAPLKKAVQAAVKAKWGDHKPTFRTPLFRDAGEKKYDGYEPGMTLVKATSKFKPTLLDRNREEITDPTKLYAGCYARAFVSVFAGDYREEGQGPVLNSYVKLTLHGVQFIRDGEPFGNRLRIDDIPDDLEPDEEDGNESGEDDEGLDGLL